MLLLLLVQDHILKTAGLHTHHHYRDICNYVLIGVSGLVRICLLVQSPRCRQVDISTVQI